MKEVAWAGSPDAAGGLRGPDPLIQALFPGAEMKVDWGLERMEAALDLLGNPHRRYRTLHVGGTNGKGSVASTWASVLRCQGERVGLYTSPHLCSFRERILIDGEPLAGAYLLDVAKPLQPLAQELGMSFFEASTLLAFLVFAKQEVDVACVEVGLGGRLDATNVICPEVTAVTNVARDHLEYLGDSLPEIAREKAGIIKLGVPVATAETCPSVLNVLRARAQEAESPFHVVDPERHISKLRLGLGGTRFTYRSEEWGPIDLATPLPGAHQAANAALAVRTLELLPTPPSLEAVRAGVGQVEWPGRVQIRRFGGCLYVFDVAHNAAGVGALARVLAELAPPRPLVVLAGVLGDKDWPRMLPPLVDLADRVLFTVPTSAPPGRSWDPSLAAAAVGGGRSIEVEEAIDVAVERAGRMAAGGTVIVTGSCYTVGDALLILGMGPFGGPLRGEPPSPLSSVDCWRATPCAPEATSELQRRSVRD